MSSDRKRLLATQFLKATGVLDAYESVIDSLITNGWPEESSIYDHAAYELLRWHALNKDDYTTAVKASNPGPHIKPTAQTQLNPARLLADGAVSDSRVLDASVITQKPLSNIN